MTTIRDAGVPNVEGEASASDLPKPDKARTGRRLVVVLGVSALALTGVNFAASAYLLSIVGELRAAETRLQDLAGLEKRLKASLEVVNTGIQTRLETLDADFHNKITELENGVGAIQEDLKSHPGETSLAQDRVLEPDIAAASDLIASELQPDSEPAAEIPVAAMDPPKSRKQTKPPKSKVGSAYQRIESADGKVYYRRVQ